MSLTQEACAFWQDCDGHKVHAIKYRRPKISAFYKRLYDKAVFHLGRTPTAVADYGVGGGWLAEQVMTDGLTYYGIDIAEKTLNQAAIDLAGLPGKFVPVLIDEPEQLAMSVDIFVSLTVYQHLPSIDYADRVTKVAYRMLPRGGIALIQTRLPPGKRRPGGYAANWVKACTMTVDEFRDMARQAGFLLVDILVAPYKSAPDYEFFYLRKP